MQDREVMVAVTMKASQVEEARQLVTLVQEFPGYAWDYADLIEKLLLKETASPEDGEELAKLVALLKEQCVNAALHAGLLTGIVQGAIIHDAAGRKGPLQ